MFAFRIQSAGLGGLRPNTVLLSWPEDWHQKIAGSGLKDKSVGWSSSDFSDRALKFVGELAHFSLGLTAPSFFVASEAKRHLGCTCCLVDVLHPTQSAASIAAFSQLRCKFKILDS